MYNWSQNGNGVIILYGKSKHYRFIHQLQVEILEQ